jgi:hypothetical protein
MCQRGNANMQETINRLMAFSNAIMSRYLDLSRFYDPVTLLFPQTFEERPQDKTEKIQYTTIYQLLYLKEENYIYERNLSFITNLLGKNVYYNRTVYAQQKYFNQETAKVEAGFLKNAQVRKSDLNRTRKHRSLPIINSMHWLSIHRKWLQPLQTWNKNSITSRYLELSSYDDPVSLQFPQMFEEPQQDVQDRSMYTNIYQLWYQKKENYLYERNLSFLTSLLEKRFRYRNTVSVQQQVNKIFEEQIPELRVSLVKQITDETMSLFYQEQNEISRKEKLTQMLGEHSSIERERVETLYQSIKESVLLRYPMRQMFSYQEASPTQKQEFFPSINNMYRQSIYPKWLQQYQTLNQYPLSRHVDENQLAVTNLPDLGQAEVGKKEVSNLLQAVQLLQKNVSRIEVTNESISGNQSERTDIVSNSHIQQNTTMKWSQFYPQLINQYQNAAVEDFDRDDHTSHPLFLSILRQYVAENLKTIRTNSVIKNSNVIQLKTINDDQTMLQSLRIIKPINLISNSEIMPNHIEIFNDKRQIEITSNKRYWQHINWLSQQIIENLLKINGYQRSQSVTTYQLEQRENINQVAGKIYQQIDLKNIDYLSPVNNDTEKNIYFPSNLDYVEAWLESRNYHAEINRLLYQQMNQIVYDTNSNVQSSIDMLTSRHESNIVYQQNYEQNDYQHINQSIDKNTKNQFWYDRINQNWAVRRQMNHSLVNRFSWQNQYQTIYQSTQPQRFSNNKYEEQLISNEQLTKSDKFIKNVYHNQTKQLQDVYIDQTKQLQDTYVDQTRKIQSVNIDQRKQLQNVYIDQTKQSQNEYIDQTKQLQNVHVDQTKQLQNIHIAQEKQLQNAYESQTKKLQDKYIDQTRQIRNAHVDQGKQLQNVYVDQTKQLQNIHVDQTKQLQNVPVDQTKQLQNVHVDQTKQLQNIHITQGKQLQKVHVDQSKQLQSIHVNQMQQLLNINVEQSKQHQNAHIGQIKQLQQVQNIYFDRTKHLQNEIVNYQLGDVVNKRVKQQIDNKFIKQITNQGNINQSDGNILNHTGNDWNHKSNINWIQTQKVVNPSVFYSQWMNLHQHKSELTQINNFNQSNNEQNQINNHIANQYQNSSEYEVSRNNIDNMLSLNKLNQKYHIVSNSSARIGITHNHSDWSLTNQSNTQIGQIQPIETELQVENVFAIQNQSNYHSGVDLIYEQSQSSTEQENVQAEIKQVTKIHSQVKEEMETIKETRYEINRLSRTFQQWEQQQKMTAAETLRLNSEQGKVYVQNEAKKVFEKQLHGNMKQITNNVFTDLERRMRIERNRRGYL